MLFTKSLAMDYKGRATLLDASMRKYLGFGFFLFTHNNKFFSKAWRRHFRSLSHLKTQRWLHAFD